MKTMAGDTSIERNPIQQHGDLLSDEQVVARVLAGQAALFEVLIRRHSERLYRTIRAITREEQGVEDLIQRAYVNAYARLREFDGQQRFAAWLMRIAIAETMAPAGGRDVRRRARTASSVARASRC
jgi:DNA-directed RNA polymerase specialized sigma24 family protein